VNQRLETYKEAKQPLPESYLAWDLYGAGLEHLGRDHAPVEHPLREPAEDEILLRVDAIGLCFSDTKLIWAGNEHPRIRGRDLQADPAVPGHEAAMTVVAVGNRWREQYAVGQRYAIQADITVDGEQMAFGYVQRGALAQYVYAGPKILDADAGSYLLPLQDSTGYSEAALVEPWTCVEAAYAIPQRNGLEPGGRLLVVACEDGSVVDLAGCYPEKAPAVLVQLGGPVLQGVPAGAASNGGPALPDAVASAVDQQTGGDGFDDIVLVGAASADLIQACDRALARDGVLCLHGPAPDVALDIGRIHYHGTRHVGSVVPEPVKTTYGANSRIEIRPDGSTWIIGAAGPMGQMHVQRTLQLADPPARILCTDVSDDRLAYLRDRLGPLATERGIRMELLNPTQIDDADGKVAAFAPDGFDDIVVMAPVAALVEGAAPYLADGAVMNIFAGVPLGTEACLPMESITRRRARYVGSSGSALQDMINTLRKTEGGELATNYSLAALGDIRQGWDGIRAVKEGTYPGKIVLYPHLPDVGLRTPEEIRDLCPEAHERLGSGGLWNNEAEAALFEALLAR
jgi:threonine dehydrogenase-like Zn-dependent dehydrogenase